MRFQGLFPVFVVLPFPLFLACGSDEAYGPTVDRRSAALLVGEATTRAQIDIDSFHTSSTTGQAQATFSCSNGGSALAAGAVDIASMPLTVDVDVALTYAGCMTNQDVVLDGALDFTQQVVVGTKIVYVETIITGRTQFSGAHETTCDLDLNVRLDSSTGAILMIEGSACGYRADDLDLNVRKNW